MHERMWRGVRVYSRKVEVCEDVILKGGRGRRLREEGGRREGITYPEYCFSMVLANLTFLISKLPQRVVTCDVANRLR